MKLNDIRPYMAQQYVFTDDDNNLPRYSIDDFFKLNMYTGEIIKTKTLNKPRRRSIPTPRAYKHAQDSIEERLRSFNKGAAGFRLWKAAGPCRSRGKSPCRGRSVKSRKAKRAQRPRKSRPMRRRP